MTTVLACAAMVPVRLFGMAVALINAMLLGGEACTFQSAIYSPSPFWSPASRESSMQWIVTANWHTCLNLLQCTEYWALPQCGLHWPRKGLFFTVWSCSFWKLVGSFTWSDMCRCQNVVDDHDID